MVHKILKKYVPMRETAFYILYCLQEENNSYNIAKRVLDLSEDQVQIGAGTMYGTLSKFQKDRLIKHFRQEEKRIYYQITNLGQEILNQEIKRFKRIYKLIGEE